MDDHAIMQPGDCIAAGADEQRRDPCMYETRQRRKEQREPEPERVALMLQVGLPNGPRVLEK